MSSGVSYPGWSVEITLRVTRIMQPNTGTLILAKKKKFVQLLTQWLERNTIVYLQYLQHLGVVKKACSQSGEGSTELTLHIRLCARLACLLAYLLLRSRLQLNFEREKK